MFIECPGVELADVVALRIDAQGLEYPILTHAHLELLELNGDVQVLFDGSQMSVTAKLDRLT